MRQPLFRCLVSIGLAIPLAAAAQPLPFEGTWALRPEWCKSPQPNQRPIVLEARHLDSEAMCCDFASILPGGISFRVEADCIAGGEHGHEFFTFAVLDGKLYWNWGDRQDAFVRCHD